MFGKHYTNTTPNTTPTLHPTLSLVLGEFGGECWGSVGHTSTPALFLYIKGVQPNWGGVSVISLATSRNFIGGEMAFLLGQAAFSLSPANNFS